MDISFAEEHANAVLQAWYPGARGGKAAADLLFGHCSPSGKLPVTFYYNTNQLPEFTDYSMKGRTYRYMEEKALYPFGYGLTYSKAAVTDAVLKNEPSADTDIEVSVTVKNEGNADVEEVVQIYIKDRDSELAVKNYSLCGFQRVSLKAGEEKSIDMVIDRRAMTVVDEEGERSVKGKVFTLYVGISQPDARSVELTGTRPVEIIFTI